jgi:hypothetical protein
VLCRVWTALVTLWLTGIHGSLPLPIINGKSIVMQLGLHPWLIMIILVLLETRDFVSERPKFKPHLHYGLDLWPWATYLNLWAPVKWHSHSSLLCVFVCVCCMEDTFRKFLEYGSYTTNERNLILQNLFLLFCSPGRIIRMWLLVRLIRNGYACVVLCTF